MNECRPQNSGPNPVTFWFLIGRTLGHRAVGPSSLDEILAADLVQTESCSSVQIIVMNT